jgi:hypothetical protein
MPAEATPDGDAHAVTVRIGHEEIVIRQRYEVVSIVNDILIAVWFTLGSVLFFNESTVTLGTWFFLAGSIQLLVRPVIRLSRHVHLQRTRAGSAVGRPSDLPDDF